MFDKFGEFDSVEELNEAARGFLKEGDTKSLLELAKENGIDREDAEDYIDGITEELVNPYMAAYGRLCAEEVYDRKKTSAEKMVLRIVRDMTKTMCTDQDMAVAVMKKGKRTEEIMKAMREAARKYQSGGVGICCGTDRELRMIIKTYYLGTKEEFDKRIETLYGQEAR